MTLKAARDLGITTVVYRRFGTFEAAAQRAGLAGWPIRRAFRVMSRSQVRAELLRRVRTGKPMRRGDVDADDPRLSFAVSRVHPVWSEALAQLGVEE